MGPELAWKTARAPPEKTLIKWLMQTILQKGINKHPLRAFCFFGRGC